MASASASEHIVQIIQALSSIIFGVTNIFIFSKANAISNRNRKTNESLLESNKIANEKLLEQSSKANRDILDMTVTLKKMDILNTCADRYERLVKERFDLEGFDTAVPETTAKSFYSRYWELQHNQFIFWERGYIEDAIYHSWMSWRKHEWIADRPLSRPAAGGSDFRYRWGWQESCDRFSYTRYKQFMDDIFNKSEIRDVMDSYKNALPS
jgi:hypothetical protein